MSGSSSDFRLPRLLVSFNASKANKFHSVSTTGLGRFRPVKLAARLCGTCIPFDLNQCGPLCRIYQCLNPRFITYVNGLISKITAHGAAFFLAKHTKNHCTIKNICPKTCERWNVEQRIGMHNSFYLELYMYNSKKYNSIFLELYMYNSVFLSYTFLHIPIHPRTYH